MKRLLRCLIYIAIAFLLLGANWIPKNSSLLPDLSLSIGTFRGGGSSWGTFIRLNFSTNDRLLISGTDKLKIK